PAYLAKEQVAWTGKGRCHEANDEKKVVVVWVAHGTNLLRCAPHQVRPVVEETGYATVADPAAAMEALRDLRARSTTQFRDVLEPEPAMQDVLDEARDYDDVSMDYEPSEHAPQHDSDADDEGGLQPVPPPQSQAAFLYQQAVADTREPPRRRQLSAAEPDPEGAPPTPALALSQPKRLRPTTTSACAFVPASGSLRPSGGRAAVEDVFIVDGGANDLPGGWAVMDGDLVLDEVWLTREVTEKKLSVSQRLEMINAKKAELQSYFANKVWEFEDPKPGDSMRTISARWVLTFKEDPPGSTPRAKARLVLRGFQDPDMGSIETSSPTAARQAKFFLLALSPVMSWTLYASDVKT
ncbi:unnamed protein product, partial [Symbiodinium pilosum]